MDRTTNTVFGVVNGHNWWWFGDPDDPCEDVTNWTCLIEGGGDCIAECGGWSVEIFTSSGEFVCINAPAPNLYCADPGLRNCDGCLALARDRCCFPD